MKQYTRHKMREVMEIRGFSEMTISTYINHISNLADYFNKPPHKLQPEHIHLAKDFLSEVKSPLDSMEGREKPEQVLRYLSRYVAKSAVSDKRIRKVENGNVYISYYDRKKRKGKTEIIPETQFMKRLIMHILPGGFKKVRFFGFMGNRYRAGKLALCRMLLGNPITEQEESGKELLNDTAFLFWKYFRIDITLCKDCGKRHVHFVRGSGSG